MAICPECEAPIDIEEDEVEEGQTLDCPECGAELEVVSTNPVELDLIEEEEDEKDKTEEESW
jgi:alpha-aminoadipate/glutamate carrier protein LysW